MASIAFPGDDFERLRKQIDAIVTPSMVKMIQEISERTRDRVEAPLIRAMQETAERAQANFRPDVLELLQNTQGSMAAVIDPSLLRLAEKNQLEMQKIVTPQLVKKMAEMNMRLAEAYAEPVRDLARRMGESVIDPSATPSGVSEEAEKSIKQEFVDLSLSPHEVTTLYWLFGAYVTVLVTIGAGLSGEVARGIQTGMGMIMLLLHLRSQESK